MEWGAGPGRGTLATRWALDHHLNGVPLETLVAADFAWQEGWEYQVLTCHPMKRPRTQADPTYGIYVQDPAFWDAG
jgi:hypothetical protein